jgi:NAD(P)-dependent dehydrogenase (short-subunit alcohol dehydrogenase family)
VKTALVTGAGRGIGLATVRLFLEHEFQVIGLDRDFNAQFPKKAKRVVYDLTDLAGIPKLVDSLGDIHVLVNNAGIQNAVPIDRYTDEMRSRILRVNLEAPVELMRAVSRQMIERREGRIVNLASIAAWQPHPDLWYGATKAALASATKSFALYLGRHGIQVNAVAPGPVDTELLKVVDSARREGLLKIAYSGRMGRAEEIAATIVWLAAASPAILNGAILDVNDGTYPRS